MVVRDREVVGMNRRDEVVVEARAEIAAEQREYEKKTIKWVLEQIAELQHALAYQEEMLEKYCSGEWTPENRKSIDTRRSD